MIIYLDESGNLGFDFHQKKTTCYLVIGLLVCTGIVAQSAIIKAVKRTLKNKLPKYTPELKGNKLTLPIKQYFLKEAMRQTDWCLYTAVTDKKSWMNHHVAHHDKGFDKKSLYNEVAKRLLFQLNNLDKTQCIDIFVDRSKNNNEILVFDDLIISALTNRLAKNTRLSIKHRNSHEDVGLQAIDIFCSGIGKKYEYNDITWYKEFSSRIAVEVEYKS